MVYRPQEVLAVLWVVVCLDAVEFNLISSDEVEGVAISEEQHKEDEGEYLDL